ncbi:MAG TPA: sensor histidine kinase [Burkholderiales bacterium]|nr:sensor histidine kinase [Burkholderiales bacterium]
MNGPRSLKWHLAQVLLAGILPLGVFAAVLLFLHWQAQDQKRRDAQMETTRLLAVAVDNALDSTAQRLTILARVWGASPSDHARLYEHARSAVTATSDWVHILAFTDRGEGIFRTDRPFGEAMPQARLREYSAGALRENRPAISDLFRSALDGRPTARVAVPVAREGTVTHVLIASLKLQWFDELLTRQGLPEGGIAGIFDREMKFIARSHDGEARRGADPAPDLHEDMKRAAAGIGRYPSLDGTHVYTSWTRTRHGWWVALATPAAPIDGAFWRTMAALGALLLLVVLAGLGFAGLKGRRIAASLQLVERRAADLARGEPLHPVAASPVAEIDRALKALDRLLEAEQQGRARAEQANRAKDEFLALLGHELRNPLAAVANAAAVVRAERCTPAQLEFAANVIQRQTRHLKRLIDDLLDVGRVMNGKIRLERQPLELQTSLHDALATAHGARMLAGRVVQVQAEPVWIDGDPTRFEQIVSNLLANAAAHTPAGGTVRVSLGARDGHAVLEVADSGSGISPEEQPLIFEPFYQSATTRERGSGGLGIGLTLVKRLVALHGGEVSVHSEGAGRGATFTVRLPVIDAAVARGAEANEPAALHSHAVS